ncbi:hypothetical protein M5689_006502 [Euphorbia peplus]|nr:hypothetical protein M5689_006502 [Euphorbia peplus]
MAPGGLRNKKRKFENNNSQSPLFSSTNRPNHNSPIEKGIQGLHNRAKSTQNHDQTNRSEENNPTLSSVSSNENISRLPELNEIQSSESVQDESIHTEINSRKRSRGITMGKGIMKTFHASGSKLKITVDPSIGRPKDTEESAKLASQIGVVTRDVLPIPIKWKEVDKEKDLGVGFDHLGIHMDINLDDPGVKDCLVNRLQISIRNKRYKLGQHFKKFATLEEAKRNKPTFCSDQKNWKSLCDYFTSEKFKKASAKNSENRKNVKAPHVTGRKAFTVVQNEIIQKELNGEPCDRIELYKRTHYSEKKGWSSATAEDNWNLMKEKQAKYNEEEILKTEGEIVEEVLGRGSGYMKGLGYGPKPPSRRTSHDFDRQQLEKEYRDTQEQLKNSQAEVEHLKDYVASMKDQLSSQGASIEKLIACMEANGINI